MDEDACYNVGEDKLCQAYIRLYMIDYENDEFDCTFDYLQKIQSMDKKYKPDLILYLMGDAYFQDGKTEKALEYFVKCYDHLVKTDDIMMYYAKDLERLYRALCVCY